MIRPSTDPSLVALLFLKCACEGMSSPSGFSEGHYGDRLVKAFETFAAQGGAAATRVLRYAFPAGESSKNRDTKSAIEETRKQSEA